VVEQLGLAAYADRRAGVLSQGNAQRLGLAKALLHRPRLLILDEPTNGLDPAGIVEVRELLLRLTRAEGVTILMSSHILGEVTRLAQRFGFIHQGRLLQEMDVEELKRNRRRTLRIHARCPEVAAAALEAAGHRVAVDTAGRIEVTDGAALDEPDAIACRLVAAGAPPTHLVVDEEELEPYFLRLIGMPGNGGVAASDLNLNLNLNLNGGAHVELSRGCDLD
jgi:ABC-2 type transport system ATP-binding protein